MGSLCQSPPRVAGGERLRGRDRRPGGLFCDRAAGAIGPGAGTLAQWRLMQVVTAAGVVGAIAIDATAGWLRGFWPVAVIVIAIVLGEVLADQLATREHVRRRGVRQKNLQYAADWLADDFVEHQVFPGTTPDKKGAIDSYRIFFAASPDMTAEIHDMIAAGDPGCDRSHLPGDRPGWIHPGHSGHREGLRDGSHVPKSGSTTRVRSPSTGESSTPSPRWRSLVAAIPR